MGTRDLHTFFAGGRDYYGYQAAARRAEAGRQMLRATEVDVAMQARLDYLNVLRERENLRVTTELRRDIEERLRVTRESFEAALAPRRMEDFGMYAAHPMSSCRMAADPAKSVVGVDGQAHGLRDLYLADASVFPSSLGRNPQLTTMAVATVIGRHLV